MVENNLILLDSNIVIYTGLPEYHKLRESLKKHPVAASEISYLEVLGYHKLSEKDKIYFQNFFNYCSLLPITHIVIKEATLLRQVKKMSLGDSIIAATGIIYNIPLMTMDAKDFKHLSELNLILPSEY